MKNDSYKEWFYQAEYDLKTAEAMFTSKRYLYCVFFCHLAIEKGLKGRLVKKKNIFPPKTHNLIYLIEKMQMELSETDLTFVYRLNDASIPARYPEDLKKIIKAYNAKNTSDILKQTKVLLKWIKEK